MKLLFTDFKLPYLLRDADYPVGGWSVELMAWLGALKDSGHSAGVLTWRGANAYVGDQDLCTLLETYDPNKGIRVAKYLYSYIPSMVAAARAYRPDAVIQACAGVETGMMAHVARRLGVPFVHRVASDVDADDRYKAKLSVVEQIAFRYGLRRAAGILCQNDYQRQSLGARYPQATLRIIHNPFDLPPDRPAVRSRGERGYVAWLGVFKKAKDMPLLVAVARAHPTVKFQVAGMPGLNIDAETTAALAALKTLPNVTLVGYVKRSAVYDFLSRASAVLCTSAYEGFSNIFLEAFAAGTPVLARRAVDPDLIVTKNHLGLTAADGNELTETVGRIEAMSDADYAQLAARCREYVVTQHAGRVKVRELTAALEPLVQTREPA